MDRRWTGKQASRAFIGGAFGPRRNRAQELDYFGRRRRRSACPSACVRAALPRSHGHGRGRVAAECRHGMKSEIRSPKPVLSDVEGSETRNKLKNPTTTMFQTRSIEAGVLDLFDFEIHLALVCFGFRDSDFEFYMIVRVARENFLEVLVLNFCNVNIWQG